MALKKNVRKDNTYMISTDSTDNPKLGAKILLDGRESLFLEYYYGYEMRISEKTGKSVPKAIRKRESLHRYLHHNPKGPEIQENKDILALAKKIRYEEEQKLLENKDGYRLKQNQDINFLDYFQTYIDNYTKKDKRNMKLAFNRFVDFLKDTPEYNKYIKTIKPEQITKNMVEAYTEYLQSRSKGGEGARTIYARFKKVIKYSIDHDNLMVKNPCANISIPVDDSLKKAVLSQDEMEALMDTHYENENPNIRRAFIFCLYTGLRYCDVKELTYYANVDFPNEILKYEQSKTKNHSTKSYVTIPLSKDLIELIGKPQDENNQNELIFPLKSYGTCLNHLKKWVAQAGIKKHISWHCARHSLATNLINNNANIKTVSEILGHASLKYIYRYTRATDPLKRQAIESLPKIKF